MDREHLICPTHRLADCLNSSQVFDAEKVIAHHGLFHKTCYKCADCQVPLDSTRACDAPNKEV